MTKKTPKTRKALVVNREQWLARGADHLARRVFAPAGVNLPSDYRVSCSWPGGGSARKRIGECWSRSASAAKVNEVFISPGIADPIKALDILAHELVHVADDCVNGHKGPFKRIAAAIGLEGKMTATMAGEALRAKLAAIVEHLGPYPHAALSLANRKKQTTRLVKVECSDCGCTFRITQKWLDEATDGLVCPVCHGSDVHADGAEQEEEG